MVKFLIAPDKFKGSLTAREVAENIAEGLRGVLPDANIDIVPMADGGEGTADVICDALGGKWVMTRAHDPLGREIDARYAWIGNRKLAVIEMSEAAGMRRLPDGERDVDLADTFGVGEMILDAASHGALQIIIGLGGSATNDGGVGMARALGFRFFERDQRQIERVIDLVRLSRIETSDAEARVSRGVRPTRPPISIIAAADVRNPLLGQKGATRVFGPQKGAGEDQIDTLERGLARLADVVSTEFDVDYRDEPGAGAAGGLGFGLMSFCAAKIRPGFEVVAEAVDLESKVKNVDVVITGEGSLDRQTIEGKTPAGVARLARKAGKRVFAIVGRASEDRQAREMFDGVLELGGSIPQAAELLRKQGRQLATNLKQTLEA